MPPLRPVPSPQQNGAPKTDAAEDLTDFGTAEMVVSPFEQLLAAARPRKQEDTLLPPKRRPPLLRLRMSGPIISWIGLCPAPAKADRSSPACHDHPEFYRWPDLFAVGCRLVIVAFGALPRARVAPPTPRGCDRFFRTPRSRCSRLACKVQPSFGVLVRARPSASSVWAFKAGRDGCQSTRSCCRHRSRWPPCRRWKCSVAAPPLRRRIGDDRRRRRNHRRSRRSRLPACIAQRSC